MQFHSAISWPVLSDWFVVEFYLREAKAQHELVTWTTYNIYRTALYKLIFSAWKNYIVGGLCYRFLPIPYAINHKATVVNSPHSMVIWWFVKPKKTNSLSRFPNTECHIKVLNFEEIHTKIFTDRKEEHNIGSKRRAKLNTCLVLLDFAMVTAW